MGNWLYKCWISLLAIMEKKLHSSWHKSTIPSISVQGDSIAKRIKYSAYALFIVAILLPPITSYVSGPRYYTDTIWDQLGTCLAVFLVGAIPYIIIKKLIVGSSSRAATIFYFLLMIGMFVFWLVYFIDSFLLRNSNVHDDWLFITIPLLQMLPVIIALIVAFVVRLKNKHLAE